MYTTLALVSELFRERIWSKYTIPRWVCKVILPYISTLNSKGMLLVSSPECISEFCNLADSLTTADFLSETKQKNLPLQKTAQDFQITLAGIFLIICSKNMKKIQVFYFIKFAMVFPLCLSSEELEIVGWCKKTWWQVCSFAFIWKCSGQHTDREFPSISRPFFFM